MIMCNVFLCAECANGCPVNRCDAAVIRRLAPPSFWGNDFRQAIGWGGVAAALAADHTVNYRHTHAWQIAQLYRF
tara:strand:+ start:345 stop:569 length:225 start_codon:yes stop_codon:yes gene_type:complete